MIGILEGSDAPLAVRIYERMLGLLPRELRGYADHAGALFYDMYREERRRGLLPALRLFTWAAGQLVLCAIEERRQARRQARRRLRSATQQSGAPSGQQRSATPRPGAGSRHAGLAAPQAGARSGNAGPPAGNEPPRRSRWADAFSGVLHDLRFAARNSARRPAFAASAVLIVAVGIGATTTIFSVVDAVLLRELPYPDPERIVVFTEGAHNFPDYNAWTARLDAFEAIAGTWDGRVDLVGDGPPELVNAVRVTPRFFELFGARALTGRLFTGEEYGGEPTVAVLGHGIWQRRWGGDPAIVGRAVNIDGRPLVVVGVMAADFRPPELLAGRSVDVWLPLDTHSGEDRDEIGFHVMSVAGRIASGASIETAQQQLDAYIAERVEEHPDHYRNRDGSLRTVPLMPLLEATVQGVSATLYLLLGAVGLMLLIACANVANLFLARGTERGREIALRGALGAGRGRIMAQLLTESVAIAVIGGIVGVGLAYAGVAMFARTNPGGIPRLSDVAVDPRVLVFAFVASLLTGALFGILPALQAARADVNDALKEGAGSVTAGRRGRRTRGALVVAEIALALVLLVGAGLLFRSMLELVSVDPGFDTEQLVDLSLLLGPTYTNEERAAFVDQLVARLEALPGTEAAAAGWTLPFVHYGGSRCCWATSVIDPAQPEPENPARTMAHPVTAGYFAMLGGRMRHGRDFVAADDHAQPPPAIVSVETAMEVFGTDEVTGRALRLGDTELTIVGVAEGVQHYGLSHEVDNAVYVPYAQFGRGLPMLHVGVRSRADLETVVAGAREAVWALESDLPIQEIVTMRRRVADSLATQRFLSLLLGVFAGVAALLACGGIYGSMLYSVNQRQRELGIRMALGAAGGNVIRMVLAHGLLLTVAGLGIGLAGAWAMSSLMESLVWGIRPTDPLTFAGVTLLLATAAMAACFVPAWKASRADPLQTLRAE